MNIPGFELGDLIGQGGYGAVYRARAAGGARAAVKVALPTREARGQLEREIGFLRRVGPPTVPAILADGMTGADQPWVALEHLEGPSLADLLAGGDRPAWSAILPAIADAIADLHDRQVVHADLKPANLFVSGSNARLIDFGLALSADGAAAGEPHELVRGTAWYMAPEQCQAGLPLGPGVDVYALGVIAFEVLTGSPPFTGSSRAEIHHAHLALRPPPMRGQPAALEALVRACLAKQPDERPRARELAATLRRIAQEEVAQPTTASPLPAQPTALAEPVERRVMGLLSILLRGDAARVQQSVASVGGRIAHASGGRLVLAFDSELSENPVRRTIQAAEALAREHTIDRGVVGVGEVTRQVRRGRQVLRSPAFADPSLDPARVPSGWLGLLPDAAALVPERPALSPPGGELPGLPLAGPETVVHTIRATVVESPDGPDPFAGELLDLFGEACALRRAAVAVVTGAAGLGKSRLAASLIGLAQAAHPEAEILAWRAPEALIAGSAALSADLIRDLLALPDEVPADGPRARLEAVLPRDPGPAAWPAVAVALRWMDPGAPEASHLVAVPGALRRLTMRVLGSLLLEHARQRPLLLLVDDAHVADDVLLDAVDFAALPEHGVPILAVLLGRPELAAHPVGRRSAIRIDREILPLAPAAARELVRQLLAPVESVPRSVAIRIAERAGRSPQLIIELVRGLRSAGLVGVDPISGRPFLATDRLDEGAETPLAEWLADRELRALAPALRGHALMAAALVEPFSRAEVESVVSEMERDGPAEELPLDAGVALERLAAADLLVPEPGGGYRFRSPLVRDGLVHATQPELRRRIHDAASRAAAGRGDPDHLHHLAHYAEGSSDPSRAAAPRLALARAASARHFYLDAETHATRALDHLAPEDPQRLAALRLRGAMRYRLGRYGDALADLAAARRIAASPLERADLMLEEATAHDWMDEYARSREAFEEAGSLLAALPEVPPWLALKLQLARGRSQMRYADYARARATLATALALATSLGDEGYEGRIGTMLMLAPLLAAAGLEEEAAPMFAAAEALCEERQDHMHLCGAVLNQVMLHMARRDVEAAIAATDRARALSRDYGLTVNEYRTQYNLAEIYLQAGRGADALEHATRAARLEAQVGRPARPEVALLCARAHAFLGELEPAAALASELRRSASETLLPPERLLLRVVELAVADFDASAWQEVGREIETLDYQSDSIEFHDLMARAARRAGQGAIADAALARARQLAQAGPNLFLDRLVVG